MEMKFTKSKVPKKVYPVSLGCPKNKCDFEKLLYILKKQGYEFTLDPGEANLFWVNTCAFIRPSVEEALEHIIELGAQKKDTQKLIVSGCLTARYGSEKLKELLPEVDEFYDIEPYKYFASQEPPDRVLTESPFYAYLKISEGCNHRCSYCTIPKIRGPLKSKPEELLLVEAKNLLNRGVKELILVGQDLASYGRDLSLKNGLLTLVERLTALPYDFRLRLLYLHPTTLEKAFIEEVLSQPKVVPYFDIPIQHAHPEILRKMKRGYTPEKILSLIEHIRTVCPQASIRTSIIVGFPGEGEKEFVYLLDFLKRALFDYLGVFIYYPEEGTMAENYSPQVPYREKLKRKRELLKVQREITKSRLRERIGHEEEVLILGEDPKGRPFGIAKIQAPDIDGVTYLLKIKGTSILVGDKVKVKIIRSGTYDLWAIPLDLRG